MTDYLPKSDFLNTLFARGFVHQCSDIAGLDEKALSGDLIAYIGFDCTAPSLHVGSLLPIMMLHWLQKTGGKPITLMGGGTTRVGDPSGKDESRKMLTVETIETNKASLRRVFEKFLTFGPGKTDALLSDNEEWLCKLNYIDFLRDVGRHFSVNRMMAMDSVKLRLEREHELSFIEFNYMCLQAYDFVELNKRHNCILQMGGSDQWGNIVSGVDLVRRTDQKGVFGLTTPLITTASGAKMGKSAAGAVWLSAEKLSPYHYWQFWRNTEDADVGRFLKLFTDLPLDEIARLEALGGAELNGAKVILATEATALAHGRAAAADAAATAHKIFSQGGVAEGLPRVEIPAAEFGAGMAAFALFARAGLAASNGEARRLIRGGGARLNDEVVDGEAQMIAPAAEMKLSAGKKHHVLVKLT